VQSRSNGTKWPAMLGHEADNDWAQ
jgi:hypothetical protein